MVPPEPQKIELSPKRRARFCKIALHAREAEIDPNMSPTCSKHDSKLDPQTVPKGLQRPKNAVDNHTFFSTAFFNDFSCENGAQHRPNNHSKIDLGAPGPPGSHQGSILEPFWIHFGVIFGFILFQFSFIFSHFPVTVTSVALHS